jgi:ketosteroid isomerase-like protein
VAASEEDGMERSDFARWVDRYVTAWNSNDSDDIGRLFTEDAVYSTGPFDEPWRGRQEIIDGWLARKDEPGNTEFEFEVVASDGDLGVVKGSTIYKEPPLEYANLWLIRLNSDGTASYYAEWWMEKK